MNEALNEVSCCAFNFKILIKYFTTLNLVVDSTLCSFFVLIFFFNLAALFSTLIPWGVLNTLFVELNINFFPFILFYEVHSSYSSLNIISVIISMMLQCIGLVTYSIYEYLEETFVSHREERIPRYWIDRS